MLTLSIGKDGRLDELMQRLANVENQLIQINSKVESQELLNTDMRNKVLRKIQMPKTQESINIGSLRPGQTVKLNAESGENGIPE